MVKVLQFAGEVVDKIDVRMHRTLGFWLFALVFWTGVAPAQTTQPAETWSDAISRLSDVLRSGNLDTLNAALDPAPVIRTFSSDTLQIPDRLLATTGGCKQLGLHAYLKLPTSLASDVADDFKAADVPDSVRHDMLIPDASAEHSANEIAAHWVSQTLQPTGDQVIGVIVLWRKDQSDRYAPTGPNHPLFLLVKADLTDGKYVVRQIVFGDPLDKKR